VRTIHHTPSKTYLLYYNNKDMVCFFDDACYDYFLARLFNSLQQFHVELHAYCLTSTEVFLLVTPGTPSGIHNLWKSVVGQYNSYFSGRFDRTRRIIGGAYTTKWIGAGENALEAQKYIERVPLTKPGVDHPGMHPWSSYSSNGFGNASHWLTPHRDYQQFLHAGNYSYGRYREFIATPAEIC